MPPFPWVSRCLSLFLSITINIVYCLNVSIFNIEITFFSVSINISIFPFIEECFIFLQTFVPMKVLANRNRNIQQIPTYILNSWALNIGNNILWINIYQILVIMKLVHVKKPGFGNDLEVVFGHLRPGVENCRCHL